MNHTPITPPHNNEIPNTPTQDLLQENDLSDPHHDLDNHENFIIPEIMTVNVNGAGIASFDKLLKIRNDFLKSTAICLFMSETKVSELDLYFYQIFPKNTFEIIFNNVGQGFCTLLKRTRNFNTKFADISENTTLAHKVTFTNHKTNDSYSYIGCYQPPSTNFPANILRHFSEVDCILGDLNSYLDGNCKSVRDTTLSEWLNQHDSYNSISEFSTFKTLNRSCGPDLIILNETLEQHQPKVTKLDLYSDHFGLSLEFAVNITTFTPLRYISKYDYTRIQREQVEQAFDHLGNRPTLVDIFSIWQGFLINCRIGKFPANARSSSLEDKLLSFTSQEELENYFLDYCSEANNSSNLGQAYKLTKFLIECETNTSASLEISKMSNENEEWTNFCNQVGTAPNYDSETETKLTKDYKNAVEWWRKRLFRGTYVKFTLADYDKVWLKFNKHSIGPDKVVSSWFPKSVSNKSKLLYAFNGIFASAKNLPLRLLRGQLELIPKPPNKLRPLCVVSRVSAFLEGLIALRLDKLICETRFFDDRHGFLTGRSVDTLTEQLLANAWSQNDHKMALISLDQSAAYNYCDHKRLIIKIFKLIKGSKNRDYYSIILGFMVRWLGEGRRRVYFGSKFVVMLRGLPQGSPLSCTAFVVAFDYDLDIGWKGFFADDLSHLLMELDWLTIDNKVETIFTEFTNWCDSNGQKVNVQKSKVLYIRRKTLPTSTTFTVESNSIKTLGIVFDSQFSFNKHVESICTWANRRMGLLSILRNKLNFSFRVLLEMVKCWRVKFLFGSFWFFGLSDTLRKRLYSAFTRMVRWAVGFNKLVPENEVFKLLGFPSLKSYSNYWFILRQHWSRNNDNSIFNQAKTQKIQALQNTNQYSCSRRQTTTDQTKISIMNKKTTFPTAIHDWIEIYDEKKSFIDGLKSKSEGSIKNNLKKLMFGKEITKIKDDKAIFEEIRELNTVFYDKFVGDNTNN